MVIQAQLSMNTAAAASGGTQGNAAGSGSSGTAAGQNADGFSAALIGLLGTGTASANTTGSQQPGVAGLNALAQLLAQLQDNSANQQLPAAEDSLKQLDALIELLQSGKDDASALLASPDIQAWLAQMQAMLVMMQPQAQAPAAVQQTSAEDQAHADSEGTQPAAAAVQSAPAAAASAIPSELFVPLEEQAPVQQSASQSVQPAEWKPVSKQEALTILKDFRQLLETNAAQSAAGVQPDGKTSAMQKLISELKHIIGNQAFVQTNPAQTSAPAATVVQPVHPGLEVLAAKTMPFRMEAKSEAQDAPLFEPLSDISASADDSQAVPVQDYLKQLTSNAAQTAKPPVLLMQAPTFAEDMTQFVMKSLTVQTLADGLTEAKLSLYPQHLGHVDVKLTMHNGQLIAQFMADSMAGKEMLESQLSQLRSTLQSQGIQVDKLEVTQNQAFQSGLFQEQRQQQSQQSGKQSKGNNGNGVSMEEELAQAVKSAPGLGRPGQTSIDVTA
ncbi:Flagellar hook-length control protein FliK [Paenibacillus konkukensis]|uniref:Flagellar hook-length control protein FliK n=1 Tax=Paenibacillus konkukensis TaxID=2020716 RepID=A0ABY4RZI1_9BACL|nr:flagellar hook-length control protein FliK [Paenibacillus konkukensis]UQZ87338.1 Flagellar hook-length control protein FliK [Paenibacillus konkukensis]